MPIEKLSVKLEFFLCKPVEAELSLPGKLVAAFGLQLHSFSMDESGTTWFFYRNCSESIAREMAKRLFSRFGTKWFDLS